MNKTILTATILICATNLTACDHICKDIQVQKVNSSMVKEEVSTTPKVGIEALVKAKIEEHIKIRNEQIRREKDESCQYPSPDDYSCEDIEYWEEQLLEKETITIKDLNNDGRKDYLVEALFCTGIRGCHNTTNTYVYFVFTTDKNNQINFVTQLEIPLSAKIINISEDGVISIESREYGYNEDGNYDPTCCPSVIVNQDYALVGSRLRVLAD